jgi:protoporphyrinogen oxidase
VSDFLVLGAGPAGLGAALRLARTGFGVTVLERAPVVGGLAASFEVDGVRVDHGSHRLHPATDPAILAEIRSLLGADLQLRRRHGRIRMASTFVAFPPRPLDLARRLPPRLALGLARDVATSPARSGGDGTFAGAVRARVGPTLATHFYEPYARKIWGMPGTALDAELADRRVGARGVRDLVARLVGRAAGRTFWYPRRGFGAIVEALASAAVDAGASIRTESEVAAVEADDDGVTVRLASGEEVRGGQVWSTLPLPVLVRLAGGPEVDLRYRGLVLLYLVLDRPAWTEFDAHYFPEPAVDAARVSEPKRYRTSADDRADRTVLCAEIPCSVGDATWSAEPASLAERLAAQLEGEGLPPADAVGVQVRRVPNAYPVYTRGFRAAFERADRWVAARPNLVTFGRQGLFAHDNTHHALAMAWAAAGSVGRDGRVDRSLWAGARESFRAHVVQD